MTSAEFRADVGLEGGVGAAVEMAQIPFAERDPQSEKVFCNYHVVVMRKYGSYEDGSYEEMPN